MRTIRVIMALALILGLAAVGQLVSGAQTPELLAPDEIVFQAAREAGPDPFSPPAIEPGRGPFGGTGDDRRCDPEALIAWMLDHPDRLQAWAWVMGLQPRDVPDYIRSLTPKILTEDTPVTNHGYKDGQAYPFQSTLAAGTAVLVDDDGRVVVRCRCGNPLREPKCPPRCIPPDDDCPGDRCEEPECTTDPCVPDDDCPDGRECDPVDDCPDGECPPPCSTIRCPRPRPRPTPRPTPTPDPCAPGIAGCPSPEPDDECPPRENCRDPEPRPTPDPEPTPFDPSLKNG